MTITGLFGHAKDIRISLNDKRKLFSDFSVVRDEHQSCLENLSKMMDSITRGASKNVTLDLLKVTTHRRLDLSRSRCLSRQDLTQRMQTHRPLLDRLQFLSTGLISQLTDSNEHDRLRRQLTDMARRWTDLEQSLTNAEDEIVEINHVNQQLVGIALNCNDCFKRTEEIIRDLKNIDTLDRSICRAKGILSEYASHMQFVQGLKDRAQRSTPKNEIDRLLHELARHRVTLEQQLTASTTMHLQWNQFTKQSLFYEQWIEHVQATAETIVVDSFFTIDEKLQRLHDLQIELDKRKGILRQVKNDYPQIVDLVDPSIQKFISTIERVQANVTHQQKVGK